MITHGFFYDVEARAAQWLSDTWSLAVQSPHTWRKLHSGCSILLQLVYSIDITHSLLVLTGMINVLQMGWMQLQQPRSIAGATRLQHLVADMVPQLLCTSSRCGCLEAPMAASARKGETRANLARLQACLKLQVSECCAMLCCSWHLEGCKWQFMCPFTPDAVVYNLRNFARLKCMHTSTATVADATAAPDMLKYQWSCCL